MNFDDISKILAGVGSGLGAGAVLVAIINTRSAKGKSRAEAADLLVGAAERVGKMNESLNTQISTLKAKQDAIHIAMFQYLSEEISKDELLDRMKEFHR